MTSALDRMQRPRGEIEGVAAVFVLRTRKCVKDGGEYLLRDRLFLSTRRYPKKLSERKQFRRFNARFPG